MLPLRRRPFFLASTRRRLNLHPSTPPTAGTFWASSVAGVLAYQWSKPIPTNLKIIHARVAAQALTLGALAAAAAVDFYEHKAELGRVGARLDEVEKKVIVESDK
jgi:hypothetical protein